MICKVCGNKFHYCYSCDYDCYMYDGYCGKRCFEASEEYEIYSNKLQKFYDSLTQDQQLELWSLWDNGILIDDKFETVIDNIIIDPRSKE